VETCESRFCTGPSATPNENTNFYGVLSENTRSGVDLD
jgi:hypothetical protein